MDDHGLSEASEPQASTALELLDELHLQVIDSVSAYGEFEGCPIRLTLLREFPLSLLFVFGASAPADSAIEVPPELREIAERRGGTITCDNGYVWLTLHELAEETPAGIAEFVRACVHGLKASGFAISSNCKQCGTPEAGVSLVDNKPVRVCDQCRTSLIDSTALTFPIRSRMYGPTQIAFATLFGGPLVGSGCLAWSLHCLYRPISAFVVVLLGIIGFCGAIAANAVWGDGSGLLTKFLMIPAFYALSAMWIGRRFDSAAASGRKEASYWPALIAIVLLNIGLRTDAANTAINDVCQLVMIGRSVQLGPDIHIYYGARVDRAVAERLGNYLLKSIAENKSWDARLNLDDAGKYVIDFYVEPPKAGEDPREASEHFRDLGCQIAAEVLEQPALTVRLFEPKTTREWRQMEAVGDHDWQNLVTQADEHHTAGRLAEAEESYRKSVTAAEGLTIRFPQLVRSLNNVANLCNQRGKLIEAESLLNRALQIARLEPAPATYEEGYALARLGSVAERKGDLPTAIARHREALKIRERLAPHRPDDLDEELWELAGLLYQSGEFAESARLFQQRLALLEKKQYDVDHLVGTINAIALTRMAEKKPADAEQQFRRILLIARNQQLKKSAFLVGVNNNLGEVLANQNKLKESEAAYREAMEMARQLPPSEEMSLAPSLLGIARILEGQNRHAENETVVRELLTFAEAKEGKDTVFTAQLNCMLGRALMGQGKLEPAERLFRDALVVFQHHPGNELTAARASVYLALLRDRREDPEEAESLCQKAIEYYEKDVARHSELLVWAVEILGDIQLRQNRFVAAETAYRRAFTVLERSKPVKADHLATLNGFIALSCHLQGRTDEAEKLYLDLTDATEPLASMIEEARVTALRRLAHLYSTTGRIELADKGWNRALDAAEKAHGKDHPLIADICCERARFLYHQKRPKDAEQLMRRAVQIHEKGTAAQNEDLVTTLNALAILSEEQGALAESEALFKRALTTIERSFGPDHPMLLMVLNRYAELLRKLKRPDEASKLDKRAESILEKLLRGQPRPAAAESDLG